MSRLRKKRVLLLLVPLLVGIGLVALVLGVGTDSALAKGAEAAPEFEPVSRPASQVVITETATGDVCVNDYIPGSVCTANDVRIVAIEASNVISPCSGEGTLVVTGPAINESGGQYNTVSQPLLSGDVITLLGSNSTIIQPNLFWHKQAFGVGSVPMKKLHSTDTVATTEDGLQFRVSKGVGFLENEQKVRVDFRPAYAVFNPFFAGQGFGS